MSPGHRYSLRTFVRLYGQPYSELLGINLRRGRNEEIVKWFLAAMLYSKPIRENSAAKTWRCFEEKGITSADGILRTGWDGLVSLLDEGGYTRYDFSTATKLLEVFGNLKKHYRGDLTLLYAQAKDSQELQLKLKALGKGIGDTTVSIFLRDMRVAWSRADPKPTPLVQIAMKRLRIRDLKAFATHSGFNQVRLETALLRLGKDFIRKNKPIKITV
jgi:hypothetical protein